MNSTRSTYVDFYVICGGLVDIQLAERHVDSKLIPKGNGIFDVAVQDKLVYSKFKTGSFPDEEQLVKELVSIYGGR